MSIHPSRYWKRIAVAIAALGAIALLTGASYEQLMRHRTRQAYPVQGRFVEVGGGRRIQIDCRGAGTPTVVLESGLDNLGSLSWAAVHDSIARTTRVCAYSRAGIMWSDPSSRPFDAEGVARDLHAALSSSGESAPWVMVGHSLGGPYVTVFTHFYPSEVRGLVFVDASHPDQFARFREVTGKSLQPPTGVVRIGAALAWTGLVRILPAGASPISWPRAAIEGPTAFLPVSVRALLHEVAAVPTTLASVRTVRDLEDRPLIVLTAAHEQSPADLDAMGLTAAEGVRVQKVTRALHVDEATWSRVGRHEVVPKASHYIQFDHPQVVVRAVREVVEAVRATRSAIATPPVL